MAGFKDSKGQLWEVNIRVAEVKRVRNLLGVDLTALIKDELKPLGELLADTVKLVDVIYVICLPQCRAKGLTDEQFGELLLGDSLNEAAEAFLEAFKDFFPSPATRIAIQKIVEIARAAAKKANKISQETLAGIDTEKLVELAFASLLKQRVS